MSSQIEINSAEAFRQVVGEYFNNADKRLRTAARHGVSEGINVIKDAVISNVASSDFNSSSSRQYGVPLIQGVTAYMWKGNPTAFVSVLGNLKKNDGTWRLRFYEAGTTRTNRGSIKGNWFLQNAESNIAEAEQHMMDAIREVIDEINNE